MEWRAGFGPETGGAMALYRDDGPMPFSECARLLREHERSHELLLTLRDYFKDRADVAADCAEGTTPNAEARILAQIDEQLAANRGEPVPPWRGR